MLKYALIDNGQVREIIKNEGIFKDIPLEQRYSKSIVDACVEIPEDTIVKEGMLYDAETKEFREKQVEEVVEVEEVINDEEITE